MDFWRTTQEYPTIQGHGKSSLWPKLYNQKPLPTLRLGKKKLNGAASRMMLGFAVILSKKVVRERGLDVDRLGIMSTLFRNLVVEPLPKIIIGNQWYPLQVDRQCFHGPSSNFIDLCSSWAGGLATHGLCFFGDICLICNPPRFCILSLISEAGALQKKWRQWPSEKHRGFLHGVQGELWSNLGVVVSEKNRLTTFVSWHVNPLKHLVCIWPKLIWKSGLALWSLECSRLLFQVRPKIHSFEHMPLVMTTFCVDLGGDR